MEVVRHPSIPPQNIEAEMLVLGAILKDGQALEEAAGIVGPWDFYWEKHRLIFAALVSLHAGERRPDLVTVTEELRRTGHLELVGGAVALTKLLGDYADQAVTPARVGHHARIVREKAQRRVLGAVLVEAEKAVRNGEGPQESLELIVTDIEAALLKAQGPVHGEAATAVSVGAEDFMAGKIEPVRWAIRSIWPAEASGIIAGPEKTGKTWIAEEMALALATGTPLFGKYQVPRRLRVLRWEEEDPEGRTKRRIHQLLAGRHRPQPSSEFLRYLVGHGLRVDDPAGIRCLEVELETFRPEIAIVGNLREVHAGDENRPADMAKVRDALRGLTRRFGVSFILIHHFRKEQAHQSKRGTQMLSGSGVLGAWIEAWAWVTPGETTDIAVVEIGSKDAAGAGRIVLQRRDLTDREPLARDEEEETVWPVILAVVEGQGGKKKAKKADIRREGMIAFLGKNPGASTDKVAAEVGVCSKTAIGYLGVLAGDNRVVGKQESSKHPMRWWLKSSEEKAEMVGKEETF